VLQSPGDQGSDDARNDARDNGEGELSRQLGLGLVDGWDIVAPVGA
jgi:hypothetical protein